MQKRSERKRMQKHIGWWWIIGLFAMVAANAQTPSPPTAITQFDGTYAFASSTKVNENYYMTGINRISPCYEFQNVGPLTIVNGRARYDAQEGTVEPRGELTMRITAPAPAARDAGGFPGLEALTTGAIDGNGTVRARRVAYLTVAMI
jgi:hypothetical protein